MNNYANFHDIFFKTRFFYIFIFDIDFCIAVVKNIYEIDLHEITKIF